MTKVVALENDQNKSVSNTLIIDDMLDELHGALYFSKKDLCSVPIAEIDRLNTTGWSLTFNSVLGHLASVTPPPLFKP